jgi:teichuronic acid exporter
VTTSVVDSAADARAASDAAVLQHAFLRGIAWSGIGRWSAQAITWAATLVVARLLSPADYGVIAMATVVQGLVTVLSEFGVGMTLVTIRGLSSAQIAQFNGLATLLGLAGFAVMASLAPAIGAFFSRPALVPVVVAMAAALVTSGLRTVPSALLQRDLRFGALGAIEGAQAIAGAAVTLSCAWAGWGYWSIVIGILASTTLWTATVMAVRPTSFAWPQHHVLGPALTFTRHQLTGSVAWYCYSNADFVVAGRLLGAHDLGVYTMAWTLARVVPERIANVAIRVTPAFFAAVSGERPALQHWLAGITEGIALVCFPLLAGLSLVADDAVRTVAGPQWHAAVLPLRLLALYAAFDVVTQPLTRALVAGGEAQFTARLGIVLACVMPVGFVLGARFGPAGLGLAWLLLAPAVRLQALVRVRSRLGLPLNVYGKALWPAVSATLVMASAVSAVREMSDAFSPLGRLMLATCLGAVAYVLTLLVLHRQRVSVWVTHWRRLRQS